MINHLGKVAFDKDTISKKIQKIINSKQSPISLEEDDFRYLPKLLIEFDIEDSDENYTLNYPHFDFQPVDIVLSISYGNDMSLEECNKIMESLYQEYGEELNIIYGFRIAIDFRIDIFVIN